MQIESAAHLTLRERHCLLSLLLWFALTVLFFFIAAGPGWNNKSGE